MKIQQIDEFLKIDHNQFGILDNIKPANLQSEKEKFLESDSYNPIFIYNEIEGLDEQNSKLDKIISKIDQVEFESGEIKNKYKKKLEQNRTKYIAFEAINNKDDEMFDRSMNKIYPNKSSELIDKSYKILSSYDPEYNSNLNIKSTEAATFISRVFNDNDISINIEYVDDHASKIAITDDNLMISKKYVTNEDQLIKTAYHEMVHAIISKNSLSQCGLYKFGGSHDYIIKEEGVATLLGFTRMSNKKMYHPALLIIAIYESSRSGFRDCYNKLNKILINDQKSWEYTCRVKRGITNTSNLGCFSKDQYLLYAKKTISYIIKNNLNNSQINSLLMIKNGLETINFENTPSLIKKKEFVEVAKSNYLI